MKKHICVIIVYDTFENIKLCFDSIYNDSIDFFIVENKSQNSSIIKNYFLNKNLIGYILFEKNIAANALNIFIKDYFDLLKMYEYITFTDGDLYVYNNESLFNELRDNLDVKNVMISSADLYQGNHYKCDCRTVGINHYIDYMKKRIVSNGYNLKHTANNFITLKNENLNILNNLYYIDSNILKKVKENHKLWVATKNNIVYHLTWDLYYDGNYYYEFKKENINEIWKIVEEVTYQKII